jgi:Uma2 family endonuclease
MSTVLEAPEERALDKYTHLPDHSELVNGEIVELPPMSSYAIQVANRLNRTVTLYLATNDIGDTAVEQLFRIPLPEDRSRNRRPDMAYISYERWPKSRPFPFTGNAWDVVPDIAVEVVSPGDAADELIAKAREYLRGGVRLVWIVYPLAQEIHAYMPGVRDVRVYFATDELDAGDLLPGFHTSVGALFPPTEPTTPTNQPEPAA